MRFVRSLFLHAVGLLIAAPCLAAGVADPLLLRPLREDATLHDVAFVDADYGWAVGDRGAIWHTADGGKSWRTQESGVQDRLVAVCFLDKLHGWAVGAQYPAYSSDSIGVMLQTRDGGATWQHDRSLMLPGLREVQFFNAQNGWALGESSALFPSGLFITDNGGRSWSPVSSDSADGWLAGDFLDANTGVAAGAHGRLAIVRRRGVESTRTPDLGLRNIRRMKLSAPQSGWLVGDGGLIMQSSDLGRSWQLPTGDVRSLAPDELDLRAIEVRGPLVWAAGSPGSRVLFSPDGGTSWEAFSTGQQLPIEDVVMIDDQHGHAVGALGLIMATHDGGHTWVRERGSATRAAVLGLFSEASDVPWELFARLSGNEGYTSAMELLNRNDVEPTSSSRSRQDDRAASALAACGAGMSEVAWRFPLRQPGVNRTPEKWTADWDRVNDGQAISRLETHLVRQIRQWRPEIVVTHAASMRGSDPLGHMLNQVVLRAVEQAADATRYPEHSTQLGLNPWTVRKVFGALPAAQLGAVNVTSSQLAPRLGASMADVAQSARAQVDADYQPPAAAIGFQLLIDTLPQGVGQNDFFSGITLPPGGEARRSFNEVLDSSTDLMRRVAQKHRHLQSILALSQQQALDSTRLLGELAQVTASLDPRMAGDVLYQLGQHYARQGQWESAAETMQLLVSRYAEHELARSALTWLLHYHTSSEVGWQIERSATPLRGVNLTGARAEQAAVTARQIEHQHSLWFSDPRVQFPFGVAQRARGLARDVEKTFLNITRTRADDAWRACAAGEQWLVEAGGKPCPKPRAAVTRAISKPRLDGALDDAVWQTCRPLELRSTNGDDGEWPAVGLLAYDEEYLYVAVSCRWSRPPEDFDRSVPRPRDPDLSARDHVELLIDLDRDYSTYYRFAVDDRGWAAESCWQNASWNPQWFVAPAASDKAWTVECAIPWAELVAKPPAAHTTWSIQLQRTAPDVGFQSWSAPASTVIAPEGFGYAIFE